MYTILVIFGSFVKWNNISQTKFNVIYLYNINLHFLLFFLFRIVPRKIGELYVGGMEQKFAVISSIRDIQHLDNKIVECTYNNGKWVFLRERTDKSFPNALSTAQGTHLTCTATHLYSVRGLEPSGLGGSHGCPGRLWDRFFIG